MQQCREKKREKEMNTWKSGLLICCGHDCYLPGQAQKGCLVNESNRLDCRSSRSEQQQQHRAIEPQIEFDLCKCNYCQQYRLPLLLLRLRLCWWCCAEAIWQRQLSITDLQCTSLALCGRGCPVHLSMTWLNATALIESIVCFQCICTYTHTSLFLLNFFPGSLWPHSHIIAVRLPINYYQFSVLHSKTQKCIENITYTANLIDIREACVNAAAMVCWSVLYEGPLLCA